jgi:hypothetical protein
MSGFSLSQIGFRPLARCLNPSDFQNISYVKNSPRIIITDYKREIHTSGLCLSYKRLYWKPRFNWFLSFWPARISQIGISVRTLILIMLHILFSCLSSLKYPCLCVPGSRPNNWTRLVKAHFFCKDVGIRFLYCCIVSIDFLTGNYGSLFFI